MNLGGGSARSFVVEILYAEGAKQSLMLVSLEFEILM